MNGMELLSAALPDMDPIGNISVFLSEVRELPASR